MNGENMKSAKEWVDLVISDIKGDLSGRKIDDIYTNGDDFHELIYGIKSSYCDLELQNMTIEQVQRYGGEGQGEQYYYVYKITDTRTDEFAYIKYAGYYDSWNDTDWFGECILVTPVEKTITVYEYLEPIFR